MFARSTLLCCLLAASARMVLAQPYCLLTAVNKFEHPGDQKTLCCTSTSQVKSYIGDLCPPGDKDDALTAFKTACQDAGFDSCSSSSSPSSALVSSTKAASASAGFPYKSSNSAPYPIVYTSTYFDTVCSCTKTKALSSTVVAGSTGFATGAAPSATGTLGSSASASSGSGSGSNSGYRSSGSSGFGAAATGSPIAPVAPSKTGSAGSSGFTGAATKNIGSVAAGLLAVAGIAVAL